MSTLLRVLTTYLETELNNNSKGVKFDLGYLFDRDIEGFTICIDGAAGTYLTEDQGFIPGMFGKFTGSFNKPLNFITTHQLSKGGTTGLLFSLVDPDDEDLGTLYEDTLFALEEFENRMTGRKQADGKLIRLVVNDMIYKISINSAPGQDVGLVKYGSGWRTLFSISIAIKAGSGIFYGEGIKHEIKRYLADDEDYATIELPDVKESLASAFEYSQPNNDKEAFAGANSTIYTKTFFVYYPDIILDDKGEAAANQVPGRDLIVELFRRVADKTYVVDSRYTVRTTYPDFTTVRHFKFVSGAPTETRGTEVSMNITLAPYKEILI